MQIKGRRGADTLVGTEREDFIFGLAGDDVIYGNGGPDWLYGGEGADTMYLTASGVQAWGEAGDDRFLIAANPGLTFQSTIDGGEGVDTVDLRGISLPTSPYSSSQTWTVDGTQLIGSNFTFNNIEKLWASDNASYFNLAAASYALEVHGSAFGDTFYVPTAAGTLYGEGGNDIFQLSSYPYTRGTVTIDGGIGSDTLTIGNSGTVDLATGAAIVDGVSYVIRDIENVGFQYYTSGSGSLYGNDADNRLQLAYYAYGDTQQRVLEGRGGNDVLTGSTAADLIDGGAGDDFVLGYGGADRLIGGDGVDTLSFSNLGGPIYVEMSNRGATVLISGSARPTVSGFENVQGSLSGQNQLIGNRYDNQLTGGGNADIIDGDAGNDVIFGNGGADRLTGGRGADHFRSLVDQYSYYGGVATVRDFSRAEGDKIVLDWAPSSEGTVRPDLVFIGTAAFSGKAGEVRFEIGDGVTTVQADLNGYRYAYFTVSLTGELDLTAADFVL